MSDRVAKPFTTPLRRFHVGQLVDEIELDGPLTRNQLIEGGFLSPGEADLPSPAALSRRARKLERPLPDGDEMPSEPVEHLEMPAQDPNEMSFDDEPSGVASAEDTGVSDEHH